MYPHKLFLKFLHCFLLLALITAKSLPVFATAAEEKKEDPPRLQSVCPSGLSACLNGTESQEEHLLFQQWGSMVHKFSEEVLDENLRREGRVPTVFISHAWHVSAEGRPIDTIPTVEEARYYDQMDLHLAKMLQNAGFEVHYDKDLNNPEGIIDEGARPFMERKVKEADVIISVCTPLYHTRSTRPSGVKTEVDLIKERLSTSSTVGFYLPLLVSWDRNCHPNDLLVGQDLERMNQAIYLDLRDKSTFISNMWQVFHRLWNTIKLKWKDHPNFSHLTQTYVSILGNLLSMDDYYDPQGQLYPSTIKESLRDKHNTLRIFTTPLQKINPVEIANLIKQEISNHQDLLNASNDRDIVVFLGNTGSGKSTLINFLAGKELKPDFHYQGYELVDPNDRTAMKIGQGLDSETLYPQWVQVGDLLLFDLPGFNDTDGTIRNLVNSAFIRQIIQKSASVRFVFVAGQDEVTAARGSYIKKLFHAMRGAFTNPTVIENNSMFILTKGEFTFQDREKAIGYLWDKMQSASGEAFQKQLGLWTSNNRVWHMPKPHFDDRSTQNVFTKLLSSAADNLQGKPHARFHKKNRSALTNSLLQIQPATRGDRQGFNISGFYSSEVNLPLQNMFLSVMEERINKIQNQQNRTLQEQWKRISCGEEGDLIPHKVLNLTVLEYDTETKAYEEPEEIKLLKEVCHDPYENAHQEFQRNYN